MTEAVTRQRKARKKGGGSEGVAVPVPGNPEELDLRLEIDRLRLKLEEVLATAASNERIWRHFADIERILFRNRELNRLVEDLLREIKERFRPDLVVLMLCEPDVLERFFPDIPDDGISLSEGAWIVPVDVKSGSMVCGPSHKPFLLSPSNMDTLLKALPDRFATPGSGVLVPLCIHGSLFGGLLLGSADPQRYSPSYGTDLLEQLGIKIALCMDNCLTYEQVKEFSVLDPVTGLLNFFQVHTVLEREFRRARRLSQPLSVLVIDLDYVHDIEAQPDMDEGVLRHTAALLAEILPKNESFVGRYGSDEFLLIIPGLGEEEAREVVPWLVRKLRKTPWKFQNTAVLISAIIGVATLTDKMHRAQDLIDTAYSKLVRKKMNTGV